MTGLARRPESADIEASEPIWVLAPYPVLAANADAVISQVNNVARVLLGTAAPGVPLADAVPGWLARAHLRLIDTERAVPLAPVRGPIGEHTYEAHPTRWNDRGVRHIVWWLVDGTDRRPNGTDTLRLERERAAFLAEAASDLSSLNTDLCLQATVRLAAEHLADLALVVTRTPGRPYTSVSCGPDGAVVSEDLAIDPAELPGLPEALDGYPPVPSRWIDPGSLPAPLLRGRIGEPGSIVVTTLPGPGTPVGALVLVRGSGEPAYTDRDEAFARLFAARAGTALSAARLYAEQTSMSEILMDELLPPHVRDLDGVELAARYTPSGVDGRVGGDFYDLYPAAGDGTESLVVLGDVCGKGLRAAVLTGKIRNALQVLLPVAGDHHLVLERLNAMLLMHGDPYRFVTLVLASLRRLGDRVSIRLTSAGHPPPVILRADGRVEEVPTVGTLIGVMDQIEAETVSIELGPEETCLLHTDGVTEARGGPTGDEMFGDVRFHQELARCGGMTPDALVERVQMLASDWGGDGHHDDMAVIAITPRRGRRPAPTEG
ncbi:PP2C family protein-serine/threonine phosphatase [Spirillospora sp. NPDC047279]|uniref:PP2C family protein-serine/threonine phosphatase n=1 Tax=Spirillospora sp. NPDC047279 TaxID=3155478 RepID=UPI0033E83650